LFRQQEALVRPHSSTECSLQCSAFISKLAFGEIGERREVKANAGSAGVDGQTIEQIEQQGVEGLLVELATELREGRYRPHAVRRVYIPKPDGSQRGLGIPAVRDRIVQTAAKTVLEPIFEAVFRESSYGSGQSAVRIKPLSDCVRS